MKIEIFLKHTVFFNNFVLLTYVFYFSKFNMYKTDFWIFLIIVYEYKESFRIQIEHSKTLNSRNDMI